MPLLNKSRIDTIIKLIPQRINNYNNMRNGLKYNNEYGLFIKTRAQGIAKTNSIDEWLNCKENSLIIYNLLDKFGMNARSSRLTDFNQFFNSIKYLNNLCNLSELKNFSINNSSLDRPFDNSTVAKEITKIFNFSSKPNVFSCSGGFVIASKVMHCIIPELLPMIDISHIGISLYNIHNDDYLPPVGAWIEYLGYKPNGKANPSPRGAGRNSWKAAQYLCTIGFYARIYSVWQINNGNPGLKAFLNLDSSKHTTGIPRVLDKVFW